MNKILGTIIGAVCGAALGGGIAYVYLNKKYDKVFETEMEANDDIIRDLKEENASLHKRLVEKQNEAKDKFFKNESIVEVPNDVLEEDEEDDEEFDIDRVDPDDNSEIRFISFRDYEDDDDYEKEELKYYMADGVFTQDEEVLDISEFTNICGQNAAIILKNPSTLSRYSGGGDNELYVRNEEYSTDYKIKRYKISYQKYINSQR